MSLIRYYSVVRMPSSLTVYGIRYTVYGITLLELIIALTIIGIFAGIFSINIQRAALKAREVALYYELYDLRLTLDLYKRLKSRYPADLKTLINARERIGASDEMLFGKEFLPTMGIDKEGYPVDPFGKRFYYDAVKGAVASQAKGYEDW